MSDNSDSTRRNVDIAFDSSTTDRDDLLAIIRRHERTAVDIDQRLKDIVMLLGEMRQEMRTERDRTDQLERDIVEHRKALADMTQRRRVKK
jgi:hypothetical protein